MQAGAFDDDWVNVLFVGRMIPNKRIEDVIRAFHAYKRWFNPRSRLLLVGSHGGFERYLAMLHDFIARIGAADVHLLGPRDQRGADRLLRGGRRLPVRQRARGLLRAADGGVPHGRAGAGLRGHRRAGHDGRRRRPLPPQGSRRDRRARRRRRHRPRGCASAWSPARTRRSTGCWPRTSAGCCSASSTRRCTRRRRARPPVAFDFWDQVRAGGEARGAAALPSGGVSGAAKAAGTRERDRGTGDEDHRTGTETARGTGARHTDTERLRR